MDKLVKFYAFCSISREKFLVQAVPGDGMLTWKYARRLSADGAAAQPLPLGSNRYSHDTSRLPCPCCGTAVASDNTSIWICAECQKVHCMGVAPGQILKGGCGECQVALSSLVPLTDGVPIQQADPKDF